MDRRTSWIRRLGRWEPSRNGGSSDALISDASAEGEETSIRLRFVDAAMEEKRRVLVFLLGVSPDTWASLLDLSARGLDPRRDMAICVVSTLEFAPLRDRGLLFEYLPEAASLRPDTREAYIAYIRRRLGILRLKWDAAAELNFGVPFETFLETNAATVEGGTAL